MGLKSDHLYLVPADKLIDGFLVIIHAFNHFKCNDAFLFLRGKLATQDFHPRMGIDIFCLGDNRSRIMLQGRGT